MIIKTKFDRGDKIFFIANKKVVETTVQGFKIDYAALAVQASITYLGASDPEDFRVLIKVDEEDAFASKEALLKSL